jgi:predicted DNA-binding protein (MmcQ/YjbR family)
MDAAWVNAVCRALPHTTEQIQWDVDLAFKMGGKMFAVMPLAPAPTCLSL